MQTCSQQLDSSSTGLFDRDPVQREHTLIWVKPRLRAELVTVASDKSTVLQQATHLGPSPLREGWSWGHGILIQLNLQSQTMCAWTVQQGSGLHGQVDLQQVRLLVGK